MSVSGESAAAGQAEQIKEQIEETRSQMGETIDAIQDRLSFSNLSEQVSEHVSNAVETAKEAVYDATIGKAADMMKDVTSKISGATAIKTVRDNPLPFVLLGAGAGLLAYQAYSSKNPRSTRHEFASETGKGAGKSGEGIGNKVKGLAETATAPVGAAYDKAAKIADTAYSGAADAVNQAYNKVGELGTTARERYTHHLEENPLAVGAVALALGAAVGLALPSTRYEGELLGQARQDLLDKAQDTAADLLDKTKQVVMEAGQAVAELPESATAH